jgi:hypothetical protein
MAAGTSSCWRIRRTPAVHWMESQFLKPAGTLKNRYPGNTSRGREERMLSGRARLGRGNCGAQTRSPRASRSFASGCSRCGAVCSTNQYLRQSLCEFTGVENLPTSRLSHRSRVPRTALQLQAVAYRTPEIEVMPVNEFRASTITKSVTFWRGKPEWVEFMRAKCPGSMRQELRATAPRTCNQSCG